MKYAAAIRQFAHAIINMHIIDFNSSTCSLVFIDEIKAVVNKQLTVPPFVVNV